MKTSPTRRLRRAALFAVSTASVAATVVAVGAGGAVASAASGGANPIVRVDDGLVRGTTAGTVDEFLGIPYAAPPIGNLRWRPRPRRPRGRASATPRSSGRVARSSRARSRRPARSVRTAWT